MGAFVLVVGLVGYAVWLLVPGDEAPKPVAEAESKKKVRKEPPAGVKLAGPPGNRPQIAPARMRPPGVADDADPATGRAENAPPPLTAEQARLRLVTLVEDLEAKAERGETLAQAEYVALYKRGNELVEPIVRASTDDPVAQKEFGALNSRFRIAISKVQPRAP